MELRDLLSPKKRKAHLYRFPYSFVPYVVFEIPGNLFLKRFRPRVWRESNPSLTFFNYAGR